MELIFFLRMTARGVGESGWKKGVVLMVHNQPKSIHNIY
jgi:hypothetical protein